MEPRRLLAESAKVPKIFADGTGDGSETMKLNDAHAWRR